MIIVINCILLSGLFHIGLFRLDNRVVVGNGSAAQLVCPVDHTDETLPFIKPNGILLLKITKGVCWSALCIYDLCFAFCVCTYC